MFNLVAAGSSGIFITAIFAVLVAGWISEALKQFGLYNAPPLVMLLAALIAITVFHLWKK